MLQTDSPPRADDHLSGLALVRITGPDASSFLQGQLTQDMRRLSGHSALLSACNTSQGRVIAILRLRAVGDAIYALVASDVVAALVSHLKRYVLRAKVVIAIDREARIIGRASTSGSAGTTIAGHEFSFNWAPGREVHVEPSTSAGDPVADPSPGSGAPSAADAAWNSWLAADIADGLPHVDATASGHFVAQMLNLDLLDAIGFAKGCYTGQEIVARTQNLGRIKRRLLRFRVTGGAPPATLAPLRHSGRKVGEVLQAARTTAAESEMLAVVSIEARELALELEDGRSAEPSSLPYAI